MENKLFLLVLTVLGRLFFMDPYISGQDPDFRPIRTQEKKFDPDPEKNPVRNTAEKGKQ